eukprot:NODE_1183_length_1216_cov_377.817399.p1 GENE.NODE_1183_length_1216_cov_377.817399~~NODE_1183_length_1216_cov_377.817399.p1  ORF type:complete len:361 (-),score=100.62 NODE_1183_length_1216_cov_377.817399:133-1134(-)
MVSDANWHDFIMRNFGDVGSTIYTLFAATSGGFDWSDVCDDLFQISINVGALFLAYVVFVQFCILNVVAGLFVERTSTCMQLDKDQMQIDDLTVRVRMIEGITEIFAQADEDFDGTITVEDFKQVTNNAAVQAYLRKIGLDLDAVTVESVFELLDREKKGRIDMHEFIEGIGGISGQARQLDLTRTELKIHRLADLVHSLISMFPAPNVHAHLLESGSRRLPKGRARGAAEPTAPVNAEAENHALVSHTQECEGQDSEDASSLALGVALGARRNDFSPRGRGAKDKNERVAADQTPPRCVEVQECEKIFTSEGKCADGWPRNDRFQHVAMMSV